MPEVATSLGGLIHAAAEQLRLCGVSDPDREARSIWGDLAGIPLAQVTLRRSQPSDERIAELFERAIARRCSGEPLSYVTGLSGFRQLTLASDGRALIPRPETEGLVDLLLQRVDTGRVVDVGTGTGCIALSLAQEGRFEQVVGVDASPPALTLAQQNIDSTQLPVTLVRGDLCQPFDGAVFDALVSNPPYLTVAEYAALDASVRQWEPELALVSGVDGMTATTRLLAEARYVLREGGWLALEVDSSRAQSVASRAMADGWRDVSVYMDLFGRERYLLARRSNTGDLG